MWMVKSPEWFDVLVTGNLFGGHHHRPGRYTQGGMGIAAGGNINPEGVSMFEPIGGSAPKYTGKNVINPVCRHLCHADMPRNPREEKAAKRLTRPSALVTANKLKRLAAGKMATHDAGRRHG
jgi:3-isopropylmalate dehydrogenase